MDERVTRIVNLLFRDVAPSEEVQALRDEVLNNCQDRFADLVRSGLSEEEGLAAVAESLKGMDEVLKDYPRNEGTAEQEAAEEPAAEKAPEQEAAEKAPPVSRFAPDRIRAIDAQLTNCDLEVLPGDGAECVLETDGDLRMRMEEDGTLRLWQERVTENLFRGINWEESLGSFEQLGSTLNRLGRNISRLFSRGVTEAGECRAVLRLPLSAHPETRIRTTSGDITWREIVPGKEMILRTTSGEIGIQADREYLLPRVEISTMSGDMDLAFCADHLKVSSVSGDLFWRGEARHLEMNSTSGDVDAAGVLHEAALSTTSGDLSLELKSDEPAEIGVNTVSGDIDLRLPHSVQAVAAALKSVSGEVRLRGVEQTEDADIRVKAQTVSGDLKIFS